MMTKITKNANISIPPPQKKCQFEGLILVGDKRIYNSGMYKFLIFYNCQSIFLHLGDKATVREPNETASEEEIQEEGEVIARHYCHLHKDKDKDKD